MLESSVSAFEYPAGRRSLTDDEVQIPFQRFAFLECGPRGRIGNQTGKVFKFFERFY
jgi:hypothetical protein